MDIATQILWVLVFIFCSATVIIVTVIFVLLSKYKHNVTIRMDTATGKRIKKTKAMEINGTSKWKFLFKKIEVIAPPSECIEMDEKGKLHVDCYISRDGEISYRRDPWKFKDIPEDIKELKTTNPEQYKIKLDEWRKTDNIIESNPLTPKQKSELIRQEQKRAEWKKNGFLNTIEKLAPLIALMIIFICLLVFYGSIAEPSLQMADKISTLTEKQAKIAEEQAKTMNIISNLIKERQIIEGKDIQESLVNEGGTE